MAKKKSTGKRKRKTKKGPERSRPSLAKEGPEARSEQKVDDELDELLEKELIEEPEEKELIEEPEEKELIEEPEEKELIEKPEEKETEVTKEKAPEVPEDEKKGREEKRIDKIAEKEADEFRQKLKDRRGAFTPSTVRKKDTKPVKRTWKPKVAGVLLVVIAIIGLITSTNLILTANNTPLYSPDSGGIKGYVLNEDNERLVGAMVMVEGTDLVTYTNENGKFKITDIPRGEHTLVATFPGYNTIKFPTMILGGTKVDSIGDTNLTLPKAQVDLEDRTTGTGPVRGVITDNNGNPENNVTVTDLVNGNNITTGVDGRFDLGAMVVGVGEIKVTKALYNEQTIRFYITPHRDELEILLSPGNGSDTLDMTEGLVWVSGTVQDTAGRPVPNALVEANGTAVMTDNAGTFMLQVEAGEVTITATAEAMSSTSIKTFLDGSGGDFGFEVKASTAKVLPGDRGPLTSRLQVCGLVIIAMSVFVLFTGLVSTRRTRFWVVITGSLFGSVFMLVTFQFGIILGLVAFGLLLFSRREFG